MEDRDDFNVPLARCYYARRTGINEICRLWRISFKLVWFGLAWFGLGLDWIGLGGCWLS